MKAFVGGYLLTWYPTQRKTRFSLGSWKLAGWLAGWVWAWVWVWVWVWVGVRVVQGFEATSYISDQLKQNEIMPSG